MTLSPTLHQSYLTVPKLDTPIANPDGTVAPAWYRFLIGLYNRAGGSMLAQPNGVFIGQAPIGAGAPLAAYSTVDGSLIGIIQLTNQPGGTPEVQTVTTSPFLFSPSAVGGNLVAASGKVELSRDSGAWYTIGLQGGIIPVLSNDTVRVSWTGTAPAVTFFPMVRTQ